jgi:hypothetical protein
MTARTGRWARATVELHDMRIGGAVMLAGAVLLPVLPGPNGLPCPLRSLTGVPCPLCGMTTSVTAAVHFHLQSAMAANPAGVVAVVVALGLLVLRRRRTASVPVWALPVALLLMEVWELARFGLL